MARYEFVVEERRYYSVIGEGSNIKEAKEDAKEAFARQVKENNITPFSQPEPLVSFCRREDDSKGTVKSS